ncbi:hypothetical protein [Kordia aestuariivivens]|nr:hypothetical protein [Kordia aestuariivivens]
MKKQHSKLRLAKKVISTLKTQSIKGGTNTGTLRTVGVNDSNDNC